jgi:hypothetical protein
MGLLSFLLFDMFIAVRLITAVPRVAALTEARTTRYLLQDVTIPFPLYICRS